MPVNVTGKIKYVKDADDPYVIDCKQLGVEEEGNGEIEGDVETLRKLVESAILDEFKVPPAAVQIVSYTMSVTFSIEGPTNRTLTEFDAGKKDEETE